MVHTNNKIIPIALATDERYIAPTLVAVKSIAIASKNIYDYKIFILSEKKLGFFAEKSLRSVVDKHNNMQIVFLTVGEKTWFVKTIVRGTG